MQQEIAPLVFKLTEWEQRFYAVQSSATKAIPKALAELDSRLADLVKQGKPVETHAAKTGVKAEKPVAATASSKVKVASQRTNPLGKTADTHPPPPPPEPPGKNNVHAQQTAAAKYVVDAKQLVTEENTAYFWSGRTNGVASGPDIAAAIAQKNGGTTLEMIIKERAIPVPEYNPGDPATIKAWEDVSEAYAQGVSGHVHAVVGENLRSDSIWAEKELPALKKNPDVTKITIIDPVTEVEKVIFVKAGQ